MFLFSFASHKMTKCIYIVRRSLVTRAPYKSSGIPIALLAMKCRTELVYITPALGSLEDPCSDSIPSPRCKPHDHHSHGGSPIPGSLCSSAVSHVPSQTRPNHCAGNATWATVAPQYPRFRVCSINSRCWLHSAPSLNLRSRHCRVT